MASRWLVRFLAGAIALGLGGVLAWAETRTWDGQHSTESLEVTAAYFVPADRRPLVDWRERAQYHCRRIEQFHAREFGSHSRLKVTLHPEPLTSNRTTAELRSGDADAIFFRTLSEADERLGVSRTKGDAFRVLLVLSDINWRPLDDFYRLRPENEGLVFEGNYDGREHFPGAESGGARATYLADRGLGWGLVSADGWRVPYRGSDCVVYHEGCGHTVGLPHPEPGNGSVMSLGQYRGWLSESWLDREQKLRLGWTPPDGSIASQEPSEKSPAAPEASKSPATFSDAQLELFSRFRALPQPRVPQPQQTVHLELDWPTGVQVKSLRVRYQTSLESPWTEVPQAWKEQAPRTASLAAFDRPTPVSYRVDAELASGATAEIWGYFQVRGTPQESPLPYALSPDLITAEQSAHAAPVRLPQNELELLADLDLASLWHVGEWSMSSGALQSPKQLGARLQLPIAPPEEYRLTLVVEPLDEPNGLILGQRFGPNRFAALLNFVPQSTGLSALEDVEGRNVGNPTTVAGHVFKKGRLSQVVVQITSKSVEVIVDGRSIIRWKGKPEQLSLSDYWKTPHPAALFLGAYDCRYRFHRITLEPIKGETRPLNASERGE